MRERISWPGVFLVTFCVTMTLLGKPLRNDLPRDIPDLNGTCQWGRVQQTGRTIKITGDPQWEAIGTVEKNGTVALLWLWKPAERCALGLYRVEADHFVGHWGWDAEFTADGDICGKMLVTDKFWRKK